MWSSRLQAGVMRLLILSLLGGGAAVYLLAVAFLRGARRLARRYPDHALQIRPPVQSFEGFDPDVREATNKRRAAADAIRTRAAHVETGARVADVLRIVKGTR